MTVNPERVALTKELPGRVASFLTAEVRPQVGGLLLKRLFEEGADVEEGQPLYQIDLAAGRLKAEGGTVPVKLVFEDGSPYGHEGQLAFADATVNPATNAVTMRVVFPNPNNELLPGMYVRAVIEEGVIDNALLAPQQGVTRTPRRPRSASTRSIPVPRPRPSKTASPRSSSRSSKASMGSSI